MTENKKSEKRENQTLSTLKQLVLLFFLFPILFFLLILHQPHIFSPHSNPKYSPQYTKHIFQQIVLIIKACRPPIIIDGPGSVPYNPPGIQGILENLDILSRILQLEIKENPYKLDWALDKVERFNTLQSPIFSPQENKLLKSHVDKVVETLTEMSKQKKMKSSEF